MPTTSNRPTAAALGSFLGIGLSSLITGPAIDGRLATRVGVSTGAAGVLFTVGAFGYLLGALMCGRLLESRPVMRVSSLGLFVMAAANVGIAFGTTLLLLCVMQLLVGFFGALVDVSGNSMVLWVHKGGAVMNALHFSFSLGSIFAPLVVAWSLTRTAEVRLAYLVTAALLAVLAIFTLSASSPSNPHETEHADNVRFSGREWKLLAVGVLFFLSYVGAEMGFGGWIVKYGVTRGLDRNGAATALATGFFIAFAVGRLLSVPLDRVFQPLQLLLLDVGLCLGGLVVMVVGAGRIPMWFGTVLFGIGAAPMFPSMLSLAEPALPSTSLVTSAFLAGAGLGGMTIPPLIGSLLSSSGADSMPVVVGLGMAFCGVFVLLFTGIAKKR